MPLVSIVTRWLSLCTSEEVIDTAQEAHPLCGVVPLTSVSGFTRKGRVHDQNNSIVVMHIKVRVRWQILYINVSVNVSLLLAGWLPICRYQQRFMFDLIETLHRYVVGTELNCSFGGQTWNYYFTVCYFTLGKPLQNTTPCCNMLILLIIYMSYLYSAKCFAGPNEFCPLLQGTTTVQPWHDFHWNH